MKKFLYILSSAILLCFSARTYALDNSSAKPSEIENFRNFLTVKNRDGNRALHLQLHASKGSRREPEPSPFFHPTTTDLASRANFLLIDPGNMISEATIAEGHYENGLPVFDLEAGSKHYRLFLGDWIHSELAATKIVRALGYYTRSIEVVSGFKLYLGSLPKDSFLSFWAHSPSPLSLKGMFSDFKTDSRGTYVIVDSSLLEYLPGNVKDEETPWHWGAPLRLEERREYRALLGVAAWLQNSDLSEQENNATRPTTGGSVHYLHSLRNSFGTSKVLSTPNLFGSEVIANAKQVHADLESGKTVDVTIRIAPYGAYREAFANTTLEDLRWILARMSRFSEPQLIHIFTESRYPNAVARLLAAKLVSRLNNMRSALMPSENGRAPKKIRGTNPATIQDGKFIVNGSLEQDYPDFPMDLTATVRERAFSLAFELIKDKFNDLVIGLLGNMPMKLLQPNGSIENTKMSAGPGWAIKGKRKIRLNPTPTGPDDLYIVHDEFTFELSFGFGLDEVFGTPFWATIAPSWDRVWAYESGAPSEAVARDKPWLIPLMAIQKSDFSRLAPGETLGIQHGYSLSVTAGAGISAMPSTFRAGGMVSAGGSLLKSFQVTRTKTGEYLIFDEKGRQIFGTAKAYLQFFNRYLRMPVLRASVMGGANHGSIFVARPQDLTAESRMALEYALESGDAEGLPRYFSPVKTDAQYELADAKFNLFFLMARANRSEADETLTPSEDGKFDGSESLGRRNMHISRETRNFANSLTSGYESNSCNTTGLIEYTDDSRKTVKDRYLQSNCTIDDENTSGAELRDYLDLAAKSVGGRIDFSSIDNQITDPRQKLGHSQVKISIRVFNSDLEGLMTPQDTARTFPIFSRLQGVGGAYQQQIAQMRSERTEDNRMDRLVQLLSRKRMKSPFRLELLKNLHSYVLKAEISVDALATTSNPTFTLKVGTTPESSAHEYMDEIEPFGISDFFSAY